MNHFDSVKGYKGSLVEFLPSWTIFVIPKCLFTFTRTGCQDAKAAKEFIHIIVEAVPERCAVIHGSVNFLFWLSDKLQACESGSDKEMVLVRTERAGKNLKWFSETSYAQGISVKNFNWSLWNAFYGQVVNLL